MTLDSLLVHLGETLGPARRTGQRRCPSTVPFLKALLLLHMEFPMRQLEVLVMCCSGMDCYTERGPLGRNVRRRRHLPDDSYTGSSRVLPSTRRLSRRIWVRGTLVWAVLGLWSSFEAPGNGCDAALLLRVSTPRHSWLEARLGEAFCRCGLKMEAPPHLAVIA
jgi:hypothetical protein